MDAMKNKAPVVCPYCGMAMELVTCRSLMNDSWIGRYHCSDYNCDSCTPITGGHKTEEEAAAVAYEKAQKRHVRHGRWVETKIGFHCSNCKKKPGRHNSGHGANLTAYCPNCGAKMRGENECSDG